MLIKNKVQIHRLGLIDYEKAWQYQKQLHQTLIDEKLVERENNIVGKKQNKIHHLIICSHPHTYTLGRNGNKNHLLASDFFLEKINAKFYEIDRGGDITYHGPGQIVVYPIFDLDYFITDIDKFLRLLEESVINVLQKYGVYAGRIRGASGVWLNINKQPEPPRKICAIGIKCSRWITMHGIAINLNVDLSYFNHIIPCGLLDKSVANLSSEILSTIDENNFVEHFLLEMKTVFNVDYLN